MLTSYWVLCPHAGCNWSGSLLPCGDASAWLPALPNLNVVLFECPHCYGRWQARVIGDDVKALPVAARPVAEEV